MNPPEMTKRRAAPPPSPCALLEFGQQHDFRDLDSSGRLLALLRWGRGYVRDERQPYVRSVLCPTSMM
jgi:hypothetical protein